MSTLQTTYYPSAGFLSATLKTLQRLAIPRSGIISAARGARESVNLPPLEQSVKQSAAEVVSRQADTGEGVRPDSAKMFHGAYSFGGAGRSHAQMNLPAPIGSRQHRAPAPPNPPAFHPRRPAVRYVRSRG